MDAVIKFACQHIGALIVLVPVFLYLIVISWRYYQECKFDSIWDGKPWDEAEYQRRVKEWEAEKEKRNDKDGFLGERAACEGSGAVPLPCRQDGIGQPGDSRGGRDDARR